MVGDVVAGVLGGGRVAFWRLKGWGIWGTGAW